MEVSNSSDLEETAPLLHKSPAPPKDRFFLVYIIFYLMGVGSLLPWNFFSNAKHYFMFKLRNMTNSGSESYDDPGSYTELQTMFEGYLTIAAMLPNVLFMFLNTAATKCLSLRIRIITAAVAMIIMFILTIALTKIKTDNWQMIFFITTMVTIIIMNACSAVLQGAVFGMAGMFPPEYTQAVMGGMAMGGTVAAVANIIAIAVGSGPLDSGFGYFLTAEFVVIAALVGYLFMPTLEFVKYYTTEAARPRSPSINDEIESSSVKIEHSYGTGPDMLRIFKKIWIYALSVFFLFFVTLSCYPVINSAIISEEAGANGTLWGNTYFMPVSCFLLFNVGDLIGRTLAGPLQFPRAGSYWLPALSILRIFIIPVFLFCNITPRKHLTTLFTQDWIPIVTMILFSFSNGYLSTLSMMYGPACVMDDNVEMAGAMMSFFLSLGLGMGSLFALLLVKLV